MFTLLYMKIGIILMALGTIMMLTMPIYMQLDGRKEFYFETFILFPYVFSIVAYVLYFCIQVLLL